MSEGFDAAQICQNGHLVSGVYHSFPSGREAFCRRCGAPTFYRCPNCTEEVRGKYLSGWPGSSDDLDVPRFCHECGMAYPWTALRIAAARELADEMEELSDAEKVVLKESIDEVVKDTPKTEVGAARIKKLLSRVSAEARAGMYRLLVDVLSETGAKLLKERP